MSRPISVALVIEPSGGGSGRHVLDLARGLADRGHRPVVFWSPLRAEPSFIDALDELTGVCQVALPMRRAVGLHDLYSLISLRLALERHGPFDVLHGHSSKAGALVRLLPKRLMGQRIYTPHAIRTLDQEIGRVGRRLYSSVETLLSRAGAPIIAVSTVERAHCISLGINPDQIKVVPNGANPNFPVSRQEARRQMGLVDDDIAVGFIGRMVEQKDPMRFVGTIREAHAQEPSVHGVMMGDGPLLETVKRSASDLPIAFMGWCNATSLCPGLDMLCVTSRYEALAYSYLEAIHAGLPIVSTQVGGVEETVRQDHSGLVVPVNAPAQEIGRAVARLTRDDDLRDRMSAGALEVARGLTVDTMVDATLSLYNGLIDQTHCGDI